MAFDLHDDEPPNRLTNALRIIWIIPALVIVIFIQIAAMVIVLIAWFAILITGAFPRGMFDFAVRASRMSQRVTAYGLLTTDAYPMFDGSEPVSTLPPGDRRLGRLRRRWVRIWSPAPAALHATHGLIRLVPRPGCRQSRYRDYGRPVAGRRR